MRPSLLIWAVAALYSTSVFAEKNGEKSEGSPSSSEADGYTVFNDIKVPPMIEIEGNRFEETIKSGYW